MRRAFIAVPAVAVLLSGCGAAVESQESKFEKNPDQAQVAKVVDDLAALAAGGKAQDICDDILAAQLKTELKNAGGSCVDEIDRAIKDAGDFDLQVTKVTVNGANATAIVRQGEDAKNTATFLFVKEKAGWRASSLGAS